MPHSHPIYDSDKHFVIDPITRDITNNSSKLTIMQYDHNSERFTFEIPRVIEGHDMSLSNVVRVHFINIGSIKTNTNSGVYEVDDVVVSSDDPDIITFSWLISGAATRYNGSLNFAIRFYCISDESVIEYSWGTSIYSGIKVSNGLDNSETIAEDYVDVLEQWKQSLKSHTANDVIHITAEERSAWNDKQDKLIAGENITIADDGKTISSAGKANALGYFRATFTGQSLEDFTLGKTFAQVKEEIANNNKVMLVDNLSDYDCVFIMTHNTSTTVVFTGMIEGAIGWIIFAVTSDDKWQFDIQQRVDFAGYRDLSNSVGSIPLLTTADKSNLVAAVNEVKQTADTKQDKLIAGENITIAADGKTISATGGGSSVPKPLTYDYMPEGYPTKAMGTVTLMEEQELAFTSTSAVAGSVGVLTTSAFDIVEGQTYTVNWDGTEYECVGFVFESTPGFGNLSILGLGDDTGEPFVCSYQYNESIGVEAVVDQFFTLDTSATHTISVKGIDEVAIPMAEEFIPKMNVSAFTNDAGYLTLATLPKYGGESV